MATPANPSFDALVSTTIKNYRPKLIENLMSHEAFFWLLKSKGMVVEEDGSRGIVQPLLYGENDTVKSYSGWDLLDITPQEGISASEYDWKFLATSITINGEEEFRNSGSKTRVIELLKTKVKQAELSLQLALNAMLFGDGSGNGGKDISGLGAAVENGTSWGTYGGINRSSNAFWRNQWIDFDGTYTTWYTATDGGSIQGLSAMRKMYNNVSIGKVVPSLIITTQDMVESYEGYVEGDKYRTTQNALADVGFRNVEFKGVPMVFDNDCPSATMYFLNADFMKFVVGKGRNFKSTEFMRPQNQDAKSSLILLAANLVSLKSDVQGVIDDIVMSA
jgi:hypothetical protein